MSRQIFRGFIAGAVVLAAALAAAPAMAQEKGKIEVLWLGHAAARVTTVSGKVILIDPWLATNPQTPAEYRKPGALGRIDLILVTHAHEDHLGEAPALARRHKAPLWAPGGNNQTLRTLGVLPASLAPLMNQGGTITPFPGVKVTQVRAEHSSELLWTNPATKKKEVHPGGGAVGYVIELENGFRIYHMGDTALFGDMRFIADYYKPDLILIPIGGRFGMDPKDAAYATREWLKPKYAIPIHYGTLPELTGTPKEYMQALGAAPTKVLSITPGEKLAF
jgi:L-ascorbate metabolism protein UlaG (beta-lactamase superfamily)